MTIYYRTEEKALCPGISGEWPNVIRKPDNDHGRLVKIGVDNLDDIIDSLPKTNDGAIIYPGMKVYYFCPFHKTVNYTRVISVRINTWDGGNKPYFINNVEVPCFSKSELAKQWKINQLEKELEKVNNSK